MLGRPVRVGAVHVISGAVLAQGMVTFTRIRQDLTGSAV